MKLNKKKILIYCSLLTLIFGLNSCYDEKMEWGDPYTHPETAELPLALKEAISRYEVLNAYTNFTLGVGIDLSLYMTNETYRNTVNANFDEITVGYDMKHGAIVNAQGELNFTKVDALIAKLKEAGLTVYGHTLAWHQNQNAGYLNSLIAPTIIPGTPGESLIANGDFENGLTGWNIPYYAENVSVSTDFATDGSHAMKVEIGDFGGSKYNMQINSPAFPIIEGHRYQISFFIKSDADGEVAIDFPNTDLTNQYPWTDGKGDVPTSSTWTKVTYNPTTTPDGMVATADNAAMTFRFLLGAVKNVTYYVDGVEVVDLDAAPTEFNYVENGDFESGDLTHWATPNLGGGITVTADAKFSGNYGLQGIASASSSNEWDLQFQTDDIVLDPAKTYTMSFYIKSNTDGKGRISFPGFKNEWPWQDWDGSGAGALFNTNSSWKEISFDFTPVYADGKNAVKLSFDLGKVADVTYFVDDVKVVEKAAEKSSSPLRSGPTTIEKTPEEKAELIGAALDSWISQMVSHYKNAVHAWDVVNEPMNDAGGLRSGLNVTNPASDEFYWVDYLGKDYAVTAFKLARQYGNATDKLFINDYGLESASGNKLDGLLDYVKYIESQGASIDGIGTQMHLDIRYTSKEAIDQMFQKLATSGKLIKISELDIKVGTASPTAENYAEQAALYQYVVDSYTKYIPEAQRYGITVWCVSDNPDEHTNWLPDDAPCLWDKDYQRKHAYKGFADGLAGKDVSAEFSGELQY
ncbi:MAG: endo-1,4-beta-xylanase [Candidatus Symbiothrix sp.]|jgi:GH35 family endo-1,4-beta-xylanase|nr:endo-1,4-beta-xylanase [Candidatus Symbiothrix sp.]